MSPRVAARLAWSAWALCVALDAGGVFLRFLNLSGPRPGVGFQPVEAVVAVVFPTVGALIASRQPRNPIGWIFCAIGISESASVLTGQYAVYALFTNPGALPAGAVISWIELWAWAPGFGLLTFLLLLFPDGRPPSRRWRWVGWVAAGAAALWVLPVAALTFGLMGPRLVGDPDLSGAAGSGIVEAVGASAFLLMTASILASAIALLLRFRRAAGKESQQLKWIAYAGALVASTQLASSMLDTAGFNTLASVSNTLQSIIVPCFPIAVGIAILKHRLFDIDLIINRTLVYVALTAGVVGLYVLVVVILGELLQARGYLPVSLVATGFVAVLFQPLRQRLQRAVNRLLYGERDDPYAVLSRLGERLEATLASGTVLPTVVRTVAETLKLPYAAIEVEQDGAFEPVARVGEPVEDPLRIPLFYGGKLVGRLVLGRRAGEDAFSPTDRRLLDDLARQAGAAVHAARLTDEAIRLSADLQRSRERLVAAREEERRRLRRDLHDGLGPQLASLTMKAEAARDLIATAPDRADSLLGDLMEQAQDAVADVRRLVYALRPPALDALGLIGALRSHASHYGSGGGSGGLSIQIEAPDALPPLPAAVEVAAYRIATEALNNVATHADASNCLVRLSLDEQARTLTLKVSDDGRGIAKDRKSGVGLHSMRERAEELGGSCEVEAVASGGTCVEARLPLARGEAVETNPQEA